MKNWLKYAVAECRYIGDVTAKALAGSAGCPAPSGEIVWQANGQWAFIDPAVITGVCGFSGGASQIMFPGPVQSGVIVMRSPEEVIADIQSALA